MMMHKQKMSIKCCMLRKENKISVVEDAVMALQLQCVTSV